MDYVDFSLGWQELEQPVSVQLTRRATEATPGATVTVNYVAESELDLEALAEMDNVRAGRDAKVFTMWLTPLQVAGSILPEEEDDIEDSQGVFYVIHDVDIKNRGQRFVCTAIAHR